MACWIDRCVCLDRSYASLLEQAKRQGLSLDDLMDIEGVHGRRCGMCRPYLEVTLSTGRTEFDKPIVTQNW